MEFEIEYAGETIEIPEVVVERLLARGRIARCTCEHGHTNGRIAYHVVGRTEPIYDLWTWLVHEDAEARNAENH